MKKTTQNVRRSLRRVLTLLLALVMTLSLTAQAFAAVGTWPATGTASGDRYLQNSGTFYNGNAVIAPKNSDFGGFINVYSVPKGADASAYMMTPTTIDFGDLKSSKDNKADIVLNNSYDFSRPIRYNLTAADGRTFPVYTFAAEAMWTDFDAEKGTLTVRRTLHNKEGGGYYVGETKTGAGRRIIKLPPSTVQLLSERKRTSISQWIFPNPIHPEDPIMPNSGYTRMKKLLAEAGLPDMRFHDLRHTFATHALTSGVDAKTLSGILGHTKTSFTLDTYTHVTGDMHRKASGIVGEFMSDFVVKG